MNLQIRKATLDDLDRLMEIFEEARRFMCRTGNPNQWINGYPQREMIQEEIEASHCYVCVTGDGRAVATFCFIQGPDPTYARIENGEWRDDSPCDSSAGIRRLLQGDRKTVCGLVLPSVAVPACRYSCRQQGDATSAAFYRLCVLWNYLCA